LKTPASVSQTKYNWHAPITDFIVSDDDVGDTVSDGSDSVVEREDCVPPLILSVASDKENRPRFINEFEHPGGVMTKKPNRTGQTSAGVNTSLKPGIVQSLIVFCLLLLHSSFSSFFLTSATRSA